MPPAPPSRPLPPGRSDRGALLSVGRLAEATGISAHTLRMWERRYGAPRPLRRASGHRRYPARLVPWLRRVAEGLARGERPSRLLRLDEDELDRLLAGETPPLEPEVEGWCSLLVRSDLAGLERAVEDCRAREVPLAFLEAFLAPFLRVVGQRWAGGTLPLRHEHLATAIAAGVLARLRDELARGRVDGPRETVLLATLPGEHHDLGLHMAAAHCEDRGLFPCVLGTSAPVSEIALAARENGARVVGIGVSLATAGVGTDRLLTELRAALPPDTVLLAGGEGARSGRRGPRGVGICHGLAALEPGSPEREAGTGR